MESALETVLKVFHKNQMMAYLASHPYDFEEAVELALGDKQPYSWRAAWLLLSCIEVNDPRIQKHTGAIIGVLPHKEDGHQRELMKILQKMELNDEEESVLFDFCVSVWEKVHKSPSVRYHAFLMILNTARKYPDLFQEIRLLAQDHYVETLSPGIRNAVYRMLRQMENKGPKETD